MGPRYLRLCASRPAGRVLRVDAAHTGTTGRQPKTRGSTWNGTGRQDPRSRMRTELPGTSNGVSDDQEGANLEPGGSWPSVEGTGGSSPRSVGAAPRLVSWTAHCELDDVRDGRCRQRTAAGCRPGARPRGLGGWWVRPLLHSAPGQPGGWSSASCGAVPVSRGGRAALRSAPTLGGSSCGGVLGGGLPVVVRWLH